MTEGSPETRENRLLRPDIEETLFEYIDEGKPLVHIAGEPGVGKTWTLEEIENRYLENEVVRHTIGEHHSLPEIFRIVYRTIFNQLPEDLKEEQRELTGGSLTIGGTGGGLTFNRRSPEAKEIQQGYRDVIREVAELLPDENRLIICIDDVHKLSENEQEVQDAVREAADLLTGDIILVTAGQLTIDGLDASVTVSTFSEEQTVTLLHRSFPDVPDEKARAVHSKLGGHPLYVGLLTESDNLDDSFEIPAGNIQAAIEKRYLDSLTPEEEQFLLSTSPLHELNEQLCSYALSDYRQVDASRLLRSLNKRVIVQDLGRNPNGIKTYKIHDTFRQHLYERLPDHRAEDVHDHAFAYYADCTLEIADGDRLEAEAEYVTTCLSHLSDNLVQSGDSGLVDFLDRGFTDDGLSFYPASLVLDEVKTWDLGSIDAQVTDMVIQSLDERKELAQYFYSDSTHLSWGEELFQRNRFDELETYLQSYLSQSVEKHPDFVLKAIKNASTEDAGTRQTLISIANDLPPEPASKACDQVADWIVNTEAARSFEFEGLQFVEYLCKNGKADAALKVLSAVLHPKERDDEKNRQGREFERYSTIETLDDTFSLFLQDCGYDFIDVLEVKLRRSLESGENEEGEVHYESVDSRTPIQSIDYDTNNRGKRKHILYTYLCQAVEQWAHENPSGSEREQLVDRYLDDDNPNFRRIGFYLLSNHSDEYSSRTEEELLHKDNYYNDETDFEFYRLLEKGYPHLDKDSRTQVCEIIREGPRQKDRVEERAEQLAEVEDDSQDQIEDRIVEKWQRKRFHLIQSDIPKKHRSYAEDLIQKYGPPETPLTQPYTPEARGGLIAQKGPAETEELREKPADEVLNLCVDWEPPEHEDWQTNDEGGLEEVSYHGFSDQLKQLIKEKPTEYATEILILKEAKPQYADIALDAFKDVLEEGQSLPWDTILELCEHVIEHPEQWSSRCRYSIAVLIGQGIVTDGTGLPQGHTDRVKKLLKNLVGKVDLDPDKQPHSWIGGVGTSEEEVRQYGLDILIRFVIWQHGQGEQNPLTDQVRFLMAQKITEDTALPVRTSLGRHLCNLWELDQELVKDYLPGIFPTGDAFDEKAQFGRAWNGYTGNNLCYEPAFDELRPYYIHAIELLAEQESEDDYINADALAGHIAATYTFGGEDLGNEESLISIFYSKTSPEIGAKVAGSIAKSLEDDDQLDDRWDSIRKLWRWRLDQVVETVEDSAQADDYQREFQRFFKCFKESPEASIDGDKDLIEASSPYLVRDSIGIWSLEEWLAEQSEEYPQEAIEVYQKLVEATLEANWLGTARSSREELRKQLYENAVAYSTKAEETAYRIANRFAAEGYEMDREFLDEHLSGE